MATTTTLPTGLPFNFISLDLDSGTAKQIRNWTSLGAGLGGHTFIQGEGDNFATNTLSIDEDNTAAYVFDSQGNVLKKFITPLVFNSLEYLISGKMYITPTILHQDLVLASVDFDSSKINERYVFEEDMYQQEIGVSALDQTTGIFYVYCTSSRTQDNYWLGVDTQTWKLAANYSSSLGVVIAMEAYTNMVIAAVWDMGAMSMAVYSIDMTTGKEAFIAMISRSYPNTLTGSTIDNDGNFYLAVGSEDNRRWSCATVNIKTGSVTYSKDILQPILSIVDVGSMGF